MGMAIAFFFFFFFFLVTLLSSPKFSLGKSSAKVYNVGDDAGWTILGNVNYTSWASLKTFHVGDTIVFVYNKQFHNVIEVSRADYRSCSASSPITTYASGNDSVVMRRGGHHFFICGVPGHCASGQRLDIRIPKLKTTTSPSPSRLPVAPSAAPPTPVVAASPPVPAPKSNGAAAATNEGLVTTTLAIVAAAAAAAVACYTL